MRVCRMLPNLPERGGGFDSLHPLHFEMSMGTRVKNGIGLRKQMEARGIGLNASGSYVLRSFDPDEYDHVVKADFAKMTFGNEDYVVIAQGTLGSLAKFARVTPDLRYARYFGGKYISVALIEGQVFSKPDFTVIPQ